MADRETDDVGERNLDRLLAEAYRPEDPEVGFVDRVRSQMEHLAADRGARRGAAWYRRPSALAALAAVLLVGVTLGLLVRPATDPGGGPHDPRGTGAEFTWAGDDRAQPGPVDLRVGNRAAAGGASRLPEHGLGPRDLPEAPVATRVAVGDELATGPRERRRVLLPDGSVCYVDADTEVAVVAARRLEVAAGRVYVEVAPRDDERFVVAAGDDEVEALGTRFQVARAQDGAEVVVTQGKVRVGDAELRAGERRGADGGVAPAKRATHEIAWTRALMEAARSPLVPASDKRGGALICVDPFGQETRLSLRRYHVDVHIEDGFARTTIDQTYFNHEYSRQEGTFYFPLPPDASLSRLAMYVGGELMEGGMAEREHANRVYEQIRYQRRDPALLEWVDGSTFKMRVFPLEPREEKRILISYTQRLPDLYGKATYRFPAGHSLGMVGEWSATVRLAGAAGRRWTSPSHEFDARREDGDLILAAAAAKVVPDEDLVVRWVDPDAALGDADAARWNVHGHEGDRYLMLRYRPELEGEARRRDRDWIFVVESSAAIDPLLARVEIEAVRTILESIEHGDTVSILTAATDVRHFDDAPRRAGDPDLVDDAVDFLGGMHLVGALDLAKAFAAARERAEGVENPVIVHLGTGVASLGERSQPELLAHLPVHTRYVGVGVGKVWNRTLMKRAARDTDGYATRINPDEDVRWRALDLLATLDAPRLLGAEVVAEDCDFRVLEPSLGAGEELVAIARIPAGTALPGSATLRGRLGGEDWSREIPVDAVDGNAGYLPRMWAKQEIDRLLAENQDERHKPRIIELSKRMYVMSPYTSLLVLEDEAMYEEFGVDRGRKDHWALYPAPAEIPVVREWDRDEPWSPPRADPDAEERPSPDQVLQTIAIRVPPEIVRDGYRHRPYAGQVVTAWQVRSGQLGHGFGGGWYGYSYWNRRAQGDRGMARWAHRQGLFDEKKGVDFDRGLQVAAPLAEPFGREMLTSVSEEVAGETLPIFAGGFRRSDTRFADEDFAQPMADFASGFPGSSVGVRAEMLAVDALKRDDGQFGFSRDRLNWRGALDAPSLAGLDGGDLVSRFQYRNGYRLVQYRQSWFTGDHRVFTDLLAHAPGMHTTRADVASVVEAEAAGAEPARGAIDDRARELLDRARSASWRRVAVPIDGIRTEVVFDGAGRHRYERRLGNGLEEVVVADGAHLWHCYPELDVGAERDWSRHHALALRAALPWLVPAAEDLARHGDVVLLADGVVGLIPGGLAADEPFRRFQLHVTDGELRERRIVQMPEGTVLARQTIGPDGVRTYDADGAEVEHLDAVPAPAEAPLLAPRLDGDREVAGRDDVVLLPLPWRNLGHLQRRERPIQPEDCRTPAEAAALLAACLAGNDGHRALQVLGHRHLAGDHRLGWAVATIACQPHWNLDQEVHLGGGEKLRLDLDGMFGEGRGVARYLERHVRLYRGGYTEDFQTGSRARSPLVGQLDELGRNWAAWQWGEARRGDESRRAWAKRSIEFAGRAEDPRLAWAAFALVRQQYGHLGDGHERVLAVLERFDEAPGMSYEVGYEVARALQAQGKHAEAAETFRDLYLTTVDAGRIPPIDHQFSSALQRGADSGGGGGFASFARAVAPRVRERLGPEGQVLLAWQSHLVGEQLVAEEILARALTDLAADEVAPATLLAMEFCSAIGQRNRALGYLDGLLALEEFADEPELHRLGAFLATSEGRTARALAYRERAIDLAFGDLPEIVNLQRVRAAFGGLLAQYDQLARAMAALEEEPSPTLVAKVVRAADRWRMLDVDQATPCNRAADVLARIGADELAWAYRTSPLASRANQSGPWVTMATHLRQQGELDAAERAYAEAFAREPSNARILWDHALLRQQRGDLAGARELYRRLADGEWNRRFAWIRSQAEQMVK